MFLDRCIMYWVFVYVHFSKGNKVMIHKPFLYSKQVVMANNKKKIASLIKRMNKEDYEHVKTRVSVYNNMEYATVYFNKLSGI